MNCWLLDEHYFDVISTTNPASCYDASLTQADVIMGAVWNSVCPVNDDCVAVYREYFKDNETINNNCKSPENIDFSKQIADASLLQHEYVLVDLNTFETELNKYIKQYNLVKE